MQTPSPTLEAKPIRGNSLRFLKVTKHVYRPAECWQQLCPDLPADPRGAALAAGCTSAALRLPGSAVPEHRVWGVAPGPCRVHVLLDHDRHFLPTAREAVRSSLQEGLSKAVERQRWVHAGLNGVFVVTQEPAHRVITAFRLPPETKQAGSATLDDFVQSAVRRVRDRASWGEDANDLDAADEAAPEDP